MNLIVRECQTVQGIDLLCFSHQLGLGLLSVNDSHSATKVDLLTLVFGVNIFSDGIYSISQIVGCVISACDFEENFFRFSWLIMQDK